MATPPNHSDEAEQYRVVINHEQQYSIWPAWRELPSGWTDSAQTGTRSECLKLIGETWTDMRPRSVRDG